MMYTFWPRYLWGLSMKKTPNSKFEIDLKIDIS